MSANEERRPRQGGDSAERHYDEHNDTPSVPVATSATGGRAAVALAYVLDLLKPENRDKRQRLAIADASKGYHVFPVRVTVDPITGANRKAYPLPGKGKGGADTAAWGATDDVGTVAAWWAEGSPYGDCLPGVATGPSGVVVADLDVKGDQDGPGAWRSLIGEDYPVPGGVRHSPTGGVHLTYRADPRRPVKTCAGELAEGVDVRAIGGMFVHWGGFLDRPEKLPDMPAVLFERAPHKSALPPKPLRAVEAVDLSEDARDAVKARVVVLAEQVHTAPDGEGGRDVVRDAAFYGGQYAGAGQVDPAYVAEAMQRALDGWTWRKAGDEARIRAEVEKSVRDGMSKPRPWNATLDAFVLDLGEHTAEAPTREGILASLGALETDAERKAAARAALAEVAAGAVTAVDRGDWIDWFVGELGVGLTKGEAADIFRDAQKRAKADEQRATADRKRSAAESKGALMPSPRAPMEVARKLAGRMPSTDGVHHDAWWRDGFYSWCGAHWVEQEEAHYQRGLYLALEHAVFESTGGEGEVRILDWNPDVTSVGKVLDALKKTILMRAKAADVDKVIACRNGVLDVETRTLRGHHPRCFNMFSLPYDFDPTARCPHWLAFLATVLPDDAEAVAFLQEWFGYVVSGRTDLQKMANLVGPKRCGKGTIGRVLAALLGAANVAATSMSSLGGHFSRESMIGRPLCIDGDVRWKSRDVVEGVPTLLRIIGEDLVTVYRKNRPDWIGTLPTRFMFMGNDEPSFPDTSGALGARMIHVRFRETFYGREDIGLTERLLGELPGILNWALDGLERLQARGRFDEPSSSRQVSEDLSRSSSPVTAFVDDRCELVPGEMTNLDVLYDTFHGWCEREGHALPTRKENFAKDLRSAFPKLGSKRTGTGEARYRAVIGLRLPAENVLPRRTFS